MLRDQASYQKSKREWAEVNATAAYISNDRERKAYLGIKGTQIYSALDKCAELERLDATIFSARHCDDPGAGPWPYAAAPRNRYGP